MIAKGQIIKWRALIAGKLSLLGKITCQAIEINRKLTFIAIIDVIWLCPVRCRVTLAGQ